jgi:hypothetical protein
MKRTSSLLLGLALMGTTTGCYCMPYYGAGGGGGGMGFPLGCPPTQPTPVMPTPVLPMGFNTINAMPIAMPSATPITVLPAPTMTTPVVIESLPTFR